MSLIVYAIIVNFNGEADTIECLDSLKAQQRIFCRPIVVDNASRPGSVARIHAAHPDVEIIQSDQNLGFAGGNNLGIRHAQEAGCDYLFLVNNDTSLEPDCVALLAECALANPQAGVVAPAMYWYDDRTRPWFTGSRVDAARGEVKHILTDVRREGIHVPFAIPWTTGCAMLVPADAMKHVGGFDERYFCYWEDVDWSFRARAAGYTLMLCPDAVLYHKVSASAKKIRAQALYYETRNALLFFSTTWNLIERNSNQHRLLRMYRLRAFQDAGLFLTVGLAHLGKEIALFAAFVFIKHVLRRQSLSFWPGFNRPRFQQFSMQSKYITALFLGMIDFQRRRFGHCFYHCLQ